jgi:hypothetical protein
MHNFTLNSRSSKENESQVDANGGGGRVPMLFTFATFSELQTSALILLFSLLCAGINVIRAKCKTDHKHVIIVITTTTTTTTTTTAPHSILLMFITKHGMSSKYL